MSPLQVGHLAVCKRLVLDLLETALFIQRTHLEGIGNQGKQWKISIDTKKYNFIEAKRWLPVGFHVVHLLTKLD